MTAAHAKVRAVDDAAGDIDVIEPPTRTVRFRGTDVTVAPMTVGKIPRVTRALRGVVIRGSDAAGIIELVAEHGDAVLEAASLATGIPLADVQEATLPEFVELFSVLLEVNASFFSQAVGAMLQIVATLRDGPTSSTDSSTPATDSAT